MSDGVNFSGNIPFHYDNGLGPNLFTHYAQDISKRAAQTNPQRILEMAAGTGIVTKTLLEALAGNAEVIATDLSQAMLDIAKEKFTAEDNVTFQAADAMNLPFGSDEFDALVCQFGIMFFPDKLKSLTEAYRVLKNDGLYYFNVWQSWEENPIAQIAHEAIADFFEAEPPKFYKIPFGYHDIDEITGVVKAAGFSNVTAEKIGHTAPLVNIPNFAKALVYGNPIGEEIISLGGDLGQAVIAVEARIQEAFGADKTMPLEAIIFTAQK